MLFPWMPPRTQIALSALRKSIFKTSLYDPAAAAAEFNHLERIHYNKPESVV
jgi:hypothetical protein